MAVLSGLFRLGRKWKGNTVEWIQELLRPEFIWALIGLLLVLLEFVTPGFVILFFGLGAWVVAAVVAFVDIRLNNQLILFVAASVAMLLLLRSWFEDVFRGLASGQRSGEMNPDEYIGRQVQVSGAIRPPQTGTIELNGVAWQARAQTALDTGQWAVITGRDSITFVVKPFSEQGESK